MAKAKKLTKKMLDILDKGELRKIAIISMGLVPGEAYSKDEKELLEWIYSKPEEFKTAALDEVDETFVRGGILTYVANLQAYLRGETTVNPTWPIDENDTSEETQEKVVPSPVVKKATRKKNPLRKRVEAKKATPVVLQPVEVAVDPPEAEVVHVGLTQQEARTEGARIDALAELLNIRVGAFNANLATVVSNILELSNKISMLRTDQSLNLAAMSNALLYLLNTAVQDEGEEFTSLADVPKVLEDYSE